ncbi:MAG: efflux RND transporter periplasmic adaptor subunit [Marinibacterium sp.]
MIRHLLIRRAQRVPFRNLAPVLALIGALGSTPLPVSAQSGGESPAPRVRVAAAYTKAITESTTFIGRGEAIDAIDVVARVSGFIQEIVKGDGATIQAGDLLFKIEPDNYEATLAARKADLARAEANLDLARIELDRKETLFARGSGTESDRDVALANEKVAEAEVLAANAAIRQAELDVSYTEISAPFSGRLGRIQVSEGELVTPTSGPLVSLVRFDPIYVTFSVAEGQFVSLLQRLDVTAAELASDDNNPDVTVILPNGTEFENPGEIVFIDNRVNASTGTIAVRARFKNDKELIADGAFVTIRIAQRDPVSQLVIPQTAVQRDQRGDFVLVVNDTGIVAQRYVTLGQQVETEVVVEDGLQEAETVIVEGLQKVRPGVQVEPILAGQPAE